jgi:hypothetical protein
MMWNLLLLSSKKKAHNPLEYKKTLAFYVTWPWSGMELGLFIKGDQN